MDLQTAEILGVNFTIYNKEGILEKIEKYVSQSQKAKGKSQNLGQQPLIIYQKIANGWEKDLAKK